MAESNPGWARSLADAFKILRTRTTEAAPAIQWFNAEYSEQAVRERRLRCIAEHRPTEQSHRPSAVQLAGVEPGEPTHVWRLSAAILDVGTRHAGPNDVVFRPDSEYPRAERQAEAWRVLVVVALTLDPDVHEYLGPFIDIARISKAGDERTMGRGFADESAGLDDGADPWPAILAGAVAELEVSAEAAAATRLAEVRDKLFTACQRGRELAQSVERMESVYRDMPDPVDPGYFYVPTGISDQTVEEGWTDTAPEGKQPRRRTCIDHVIHLRAAVDAAIASVSGIADYMDSSGQAADQRWTIRTIGHLRKLRGAITRGHGTDIVPSALPMIRAGVPAALREHTTETLRRMEEVKSAILASGSPRALPPLIDPTTLTRIEAAAKALEPGSIERIANEAAEKAVEVGAAAKDSRTPSKRLPVLKPHDRQAWQLATLHGMTQAKVAAALNKEHGTTYTQGQVSRLIARAKTHAEASGLAERVARPIDRPHPVDPGQLELGARVDKRKPRTRDLD